MKQTRKSSLPKSTRKVMRSIITNKRFFGSAIIVLLIFGTFGVLRAINLNYNRPWPLMDYVPQEIGIYDTTYENLTASDCRSCHGNSLADRHHATPKSKGGDCIACHETDPSSPSGILITQDCTTSGCHSPIDRETNGWHHNTDMSGSGNCVACHNPGLVTAITPIRDFSMYPPSVVTPTPFSCENCHWEQICSMTGNPDNPGHPSTYNHLNEEGKFNGFHEYGKPIMSNFNTHHMGFVGNVSDACYRCHSQNPLSPSWDPFNPQLIRYCEICHSVGTLHRIEPHVKNTNGWAAVGFHVPYSNDDTADYDPVRYKTWDAIGPYAPEEEPGFRANQQCIGCHGDKVLPAPVEPPPSPPIIDDSAAGIQPAFGCCGAIVTLRGTCFGEEKAPGFKVQLCVGTDWIDMPVRSWTDTLIEFEVPCWTILEPGNYNVKVVTPAGDSNIRVFTIKNDYQAISFLTIAPQEGPCGTWIKVSLIDPDVGSFGQAQSEMFDDSYHGVYRLVEFSASQGTYTALNYRNWSEDSFEVRFYDFFTDSLDPGAGQRNFIQDIGSEPTLAKGRGLALGKWAVSVKFIYFGDEDGSGTYTRGDIIFQVGSSNPQDFELSKSPVIYRISPTRIAHNNLVSIYGLDLGSQSSSEVRIGTLEDAEDPDPGKGRLQSNIVNWSNTLIKVKVSSPDAWAGKSRYLWVEKGRSKSNYQKITILIPLP